MPPIQKPGDFAVTGDLFNSGFAGFGLAAAGSPAPYTALAIRHFRLRGKEVVPGFLEEYRVGGARYTEAMGGAYYPLSERNTASLYLGYGQGRVSNEYSEAVLASLQYRRMFIQPGIYTQGRRIALRYSLRLIRLQHITGEIDARIPATDLQVIQQIEQNTPYWIVESGFSAGLRFPGFQINAFLTQATPGNTDILFSDSAIGLSATLQMQELFRRASK
ncbi:MAG: hypothetical protein ACR2K1_02590 [Saprospiraceae bacterium]